MAVPLARLYQPRTRQVALEFVDPTLKRCSSLQLDLARGTVEIVPFIPVQAGQHLFGIRQPKDRSAHRRWSSGIEDQARVGAEIVQSPPNPAFSYGIQPGYKAGEARRNQTRLQSAVSEEERGLQRVGSCKRNYSDKPCYQDGFKLTRRLTAGTH